MTKLKSIRNVVLGLGLVTVSVPFTANAALDSPLQNDPSVTVSYADLNLNSVDGVKTLYQRLKSGARKVCGGQKGIETIDRNLQRRQCVATALADAVKHVDNSMLDQLHGQTR